MWSKLSSALKRDEPTDVLSKVYEQHPNLSVFHESKKLSKVKSHLHLSRASSDATREEFNSVRSILRDPNTPGTGRNVRFFSRDVYKQDSSSEPSFPARTTRPSAMELFSPDDSNPFAPDEQATSTPFKPLEPSFVLSPTTSTFSDEISIPPTSPPPRSRSRALSDTVFQTILRKQAPEADINDTSTASLVLAPEPDPFRVNATTYYTPGTMIPPTPPQASTHSRTTSKDDDILWSLRTQLALSQELCAQYEIDLGARDELVQALTLRAESAEKEREKSKTVLRTWKKKAGELERMCRTLEEEVDTSRQESLERSVMDEASGEALRMLHRQISQLEREKEALQEHSLLREKDAELLTLREEMTPRDDAERELRDGIREAKEQMDHLTVNSARSSMAEEALILAAEEERERHQTIELAWAEERARMLDAHTMDKNALTADLERIKTEHDAANQERAAHIEDLHSENEALRSSLEEQETKILSMEEEWSQSINHISELQLANEEHTNRIKDLTSELTFAHENISRLETNILEHTTTIATLTTTLLTNTETTESLRGELASLKVSSNRTISAQTHQLADLQTQTQDQSKQLEVALRDKAESDIRLSTSKERVSSLMDEVARLRRTVHEMQQESAAREVSFVQLRKERERDREDVNGLNIALDAKQQELELIKRKIAMKAPVTPAPPPTRTIRRESMIGTPSMSATTTSSRPASSMSDVSKASDTPSTAPRASLGALTRSVRINATPTGAGKMGPPPAKSARASLATPTPTHTRVSLAASTTRAPSSLGKSTTTARPGPGPGLGASVRRVSTSSVDSAAAVKTPVTGGRTGGRRISVSSSVRSEVDEKENVSAGMKTPRRGVFA